MKATTRWVERAGTYASLVKLSHTVFAAPFAVAAALLATLRPHPAVTPGRVAAIAACLVFGRSAAMGYNRLVDRDIDAENPRTRVREIPSGKVSPRGATAFVAACGLGFVLSASTLGRTTALLSFPVLLVLLGYSHAKRFTWAAHLWLGVALGLAPGGAWLAVGAAPERGIVAMMAGVATWVAGFDILYSLQDEAFDRATGLRSIPARFGGRTARAIARSLHVLSVLLFAASALMLHGRAAHAGAVVLVAALLLYEHSLVGDRPDGSVDLSRIDQAFFEVNGWVALGFSVLVAVDVVVFGSSGAP